MGRPGERLEGSGQEAVQRGEAAKAVLRSERGGGRRATQPYI